MIRSYSIFPYQRYRAKPITLLPMSPVGIRGYGQNTYYFNPIEDEEPTVTSKFTHYPVLLQHRKSLRNCSSYSNRYDVRATYHQEYISQAREHIVTRSLTEPTLEELFFKMSIPEGDSTTQEVQEELRLWDQPKPMNWWVICLLLSAGVMEAVKWITFKCAQRKNRSVQWWVLKALEWKGCTAQVVGRYVGMVWRWGIFRLYLWACDNLRYIILLIWRCLKSKLFIVGAATAVMIGNWALKE